LNTLYNYTIKWGLSVNIKKTKIVVFRKSGNIRPNETWVYDSSNIDIVDKFCYLGVLFHYNCKLYVTQKHCAEQGRKAMFSMRKNTSSLCLNIFTMLKSIWYISGADPGFQVRGCALKKIAPSGWRREMFLGISCEKSRFYAKKSYFFQF
jgi:hypothetical protein